ncbi:MAG: pyruvate dehydrogenase complex dihydrolipoamide acetyltransferase [SAR324 cluster bacterium]|nr:pyruvate dehydrogenase complex dihydrolipoamide acetyltransferase [SAR324 cluster bacterium]
MATIINMPSLSPSMEEGKLESWEKKVGDSIESGDLLANIETDKAVVEYEAIEEGIIRHFFIEPGDTVMVGHPIVIVSETEDEDISGLIESAKEASTSLSKPTKISQPEHDSQASAVSHHEEAVAPPPPPPEPVKPAPPSDGRTKVSPIAKKIAEEHNLDLTHIRGSGPNGRILKTDVEQALNRGTSEIVTSPPPVPVLSPSSHVAVSPMPELDLEGDFQEVPLTSMRKTIASRLVESTQTIPHFYLSIKVQVDALMELRKKLNENGIQKISVNDMVIKACGNALMNHPAVNSRFTKTALIQFKNANIGFAVATPEGLITPIIRGVNQKGLGQIAKESKDMATRAKEKKLKIEEFTGGTFGTSNLGMFGIEEFTSIINPPQASNLAIAQSNLELQLDEDGKVVQTQQMKLTLSCDHRVVDGALGAQFLATLKEILENPITLML